MLFGFGWVRCVKRNTGSPSRRTGRPDSRVVRQVEGRPVYLVGNGDNILDFSGVFFGC